MKPYEPKWYESPIDLPEARSGKLSVKHRVITITGTTPIVSMRQAVIRGVTPVTAKLVRVHVLAEEGVGVWMTDLPEELNQIAEAVQTVKPYGRVLVAGLGLGILAHTLTSQLAVESVTVVEISKDVINLCAPPGVLPDVDVVRADVADYLARKTTPRYDFYFLDTWQDTSEASWWGNVMPLKRLIRGRWGLGPKIWAWAEDIMVGQIRRAIANGNRTWYYEGLPAEMSPGQIERFTRDVGARAWEREHGAAVNAAVTKQEAYMREAERVDAAGETP